MKTIILLACVYFTLATEYPQFDSWHNWTQYWTEKCMWHQVGICDTISNSTDSAGLERDEKCVRIIQSFKFRCERLDECVSVDGKFQTCTEFNQICDLPPGPIDGCQWRMFTDTIKACISRPNISDMRRQGSKLLLDIMPKSHCIVKYHRCKCCFHVFQQGTPECVQEDSCPAFNEPNDWSDCLWPPVSNIINQFKDRCQLDFEGRFPNIVAPSGFTVPDKCGMCSFRIRCENRERIDGCFHIQVDKKACGTEDCPTCSDVCTIPYLNGSDCTWSNFIGETVSEKVKTLIPNPKMPNWHKRGMENLLKDLLHGHCKDINGQCKCCCHPYKPNADGTKCVLVPLPPPGYKWMIRFDND